MNSAHEPPRPPEPSSPWGSQSGPAAGSPWGSPPAPEAGTTGHPAPHDAAGGHPGTSGHPGVPWTTAPQPVPQQARNWAVGAHLSGFVAAWFALGFLGPLVVLLAAGGTSPFVRRHAVEALNFNLSVLIYAAVSAVLVLALVGFLLLPLVGLLYLVSTIRGAVAASAGQEFRYPLTIRFIR